MSSFLNFWNTTNHANNTDSKKNTNAGNNGNNNNNEDNNDWEGRYKNIHQQAIALAGNDLELAALLAEAAAAGKPITEDFVVDCQLTQFPPYGHNANKTTITNMNGDEISVDSKYNSNNTNSIINNTNAILADGTSWLTWMGGVGYNYNNNGSNNNNSMNNRNTIEEDEYDDPYSSSIIPPRSKSMSNNNNTNNIIESVNEWDIEEQMLWKKKKKDVKSNNNNNKTKRISPAAGAMSSNTQYNKFNSIIEKGTSITEESKYDNNNTDNIPTIRLRTSFTTLPYNQHHNAMIISKPAVIATKTKSTQSSTSSSNNNKGGVGEDQHGIDNNSLVIQSTTATAAAAAVDNRQHWMPDQLCKNCYACDNPFTVFRRRHHCRFCGQVFCNNCSAYFVPINTTTVRVCRMCYEHANITNTTTTTTQQQKHIVNDKASNNNNNRVNNVTTTSYDEDDNNSTAQHQQLTNNTRLLSSSNSSRLPIHDPLIEDISQRQDELLISHNNNKPKMKSPKMNNKMSRVGETNNNSNNDLVDKNNNSIQEQIRQGNCHLGQIAADHLEQLANELLRMHAPILYQSINNKQRRSWIHTLLSLATKCCSTVTPNVKKGDLLDIRPYIKVKVIPGSTYNDCAYISGIIFRKTVSHKKMVKEILNPKIMLLSGGIEFNIPRATSIINDVNNNHQHQQKNKIASLETLFEQEETYMEILVGKILKLKPDILLVGRSVSRKAQELLLKANVILIQHVKNTLLQRIARQTNSTIISSTDHVMSQFGINVLGNCRRFRLVTFRDNETWTDDDINIDTTTNNNDITIENNNYDEKDNKKIVLSPRTSKNNNNNNNKSNNNKGGSVGEKRYIKALLNNPKLKNHERQAALAANRLGEGVLDGCEAVQAGLAKRGVAHTYVMLEGCPKHLGCTVVLRGSSRAALKQVKTVFRFLSNAAYNLRLEITYLKERGARLHPDFTLQPRVHTYSTSLCVNYGHPPDGRKVKPWNGGNSSMDNNNTINSNNSNSNNVLLPRTEPNELSAFDHQAILITSVWMTDKTQCCPAEVKGICYYSMQDVALGQFLRDSCFNLSLKCQNPNCKKSVLDHSLSFVHNDGLLNIMVEEMDEPLQPAETAKEISDDDGSIQDDDNGLAADRSIATWSYCQNCCKIVTPLTYISDSTWKFSFGKFLEVFFYNRDAIFNAPGYKCSCNLQSAATLYFGCGNLAAKLTYERVSPFGVFVRKTLPIDIAFHRREAMHRLDYISIESSRLFVNFDKHIERISREARSLFNSAMNRPEHLQTVLSELNRIGSEVDLAAKILQEKIASVSDNCRRNNDIALNSALFRFPLFARRYLFNLASAWNEKLSAAGQAISAMKKIAASITSMNDGTIGPNVTATVGDPLHDELAEGMKRLRKLIDHYARYNVADITQVLPSLPGDSDLPNEGDYDEEFDDPEANIDFPDGIDADVLASRQRLQTKKETPTDKTRQLSPLDKYSNTRPTKTLGTRRHLIDSPASGQETSLTAAPKPTPGGAVKSALTRFFNRGGRDSDLYVVNLGIFSEGRPRLSPGVDGIIIPVIDEQLSTIIAYSLASTEYAKQFKHFSKSDAVTVPESAESSDSRSRRPDSGKVTSDAGMNEGHISRAPPGSEKQQPRAPMGRPNGLGDNRATERRMLNRNKSHIKHTFRDVDEKGQVTCKFVCTTYWATQFHAVRQCFLAEPRSKLDDPEKPYTQEIEQSYIESLSSAYSWAASGGKSGASFARTSDDRFVIKCISRTELQMFLDCAPAYFEYLSKAFFHGLPTVLCKIVGVYQIGVHNRETGKRSMEQVAVMQNIFYNKKITRIFDLKGSLRGRFAAQKKIAKDESTLESPTGGYERRGSTKSSESFLERTADNSKREEWNSEEDRQKPQKNPEPSLSTLLDGDFLEFTMGRPMPLTDRAKAVFQMSILNDTLFLSIINVLDYSILVGVDEEKMELVVGIIDFMRQYDILKQMERVGKSLPMVVGSEAPTIIQPPLYKARFTNAMERYFMTVPSKWTTI